MDDDLKNIVFYDGECGLCNRSVQFILKHERSDELHFSSLQSSFTKDFFAKHNLKTPEPETLIFFNGDKILVRSEAALEVSKFLKTPYNWANILRWIPRSFRDFIYKLIARNRHRVPLKKCSIVNPEQRKRFLDQ